MSIAAEAPTSSFPHRHLLGIEGLSRAEITALLDLSEDAAKLGRQIHKKSDVLNGRTLINLFFEASTRTQSSFELAGKRLGADVMNMAIRTSSVQKGETLIDTAVTLNAMRPDLLVVRHHAAGAVELLAQKVDCCVINAGDGSHEHPTQALLDMLTVIQQKDRLDGLTVAIIGDIAHSRVARSNIYGFIKMGAEVRVAGPPPMLPDKVEEFGVKAYTSLREALEGADVIMALRIQNERFKGALFPSIREYSATFGLDRAKLRYANDDAIVMHPGPMNRGIEIEGTLADGPSSVITKQVTNGVAVRMAVLDRIGRIMSSR